MDIEPLPSILVAVERGRGERRGTRGPRLPAAWDAATGGHATDRWSRMRAVVLTLFAEGWSRRVIAEELEISQTWVTQLRSDACDAVLRTAPRSAEAEAACARPWRWWCDQYGDADACARL